jgi:hypothetical protein
MNRMYAALVLASVVACSSGSSKGPQAADASTDSTSVTFASSACGQCVTTACATDISACNTAPDCASYLSCLDACPVGADGNVEATCASGCPQATSSSGQQAESQLTACQASAACPACGGSADAGGEGGILHENCAPDHDAANSCNQCIHEQCCDVRLACLNDANCLAFLNCEADCLDGDPDDAAPVGAPPDGGPYSCDEWCGAKTNPSLDKWAQLEACSLVLCAGPSQCGGSDTCTTCVNQSCAAEYVALAGTPDGYLFDDCIGQCANGDTACQTACQNAYPSINAQYSSFISCTTQHCPSCSN